MKTIFLCIIILLSIQIVAQTKKFEVTDNTTGKTVIFEESQSVKITTINQEKHKGNLSFIDAQTVSINGSNIKLEDITSIKGAGKKGVTAKKTILGVGLGLVATSGIMGATSNGNAFAFFAAGTGTTIVSGLLNGGNKSYIKRKNTFTITP